jgi:hypothetical protein
MSRSLYSFIFNSFLIYTFSIVAVFFISQLLVLNPASDISNVNHWHAQECIFSLIEMLPHSVYN